MGDKIHSGGNRLHTWDFDPLTKEEFVKLMRDTALRLEGHGDTGNKFSSDNANMLREVARRVQYSGEAYGEDPKDFHSEHSKPIEIWKKGNIPKIHRDIVEKCFNAISDLASPTIDELEGLFLSKRWHKIPNSNSELAILVEKRDSYLFVIDLIVPLWDALCELEIEGKE